MKIKKGSRHAKIVGDFGEHLVCNWLSRSGFEVSIVDHTGIDLVAYDPRDKKRLGITVKSRTRLAGTESTSVNVFRREDRAKLTDACEAFACEPWIAIYVETRQAADLYLTSLKNYEATYGRAATVIAGFQMTDKLKQRYASDPQVRDVHIKFSSRKWF
jgi:Holliday junction resolvase-like predicted endonuclease